MKTIISKKPLSESVMTLPKKIHLIITDTLNSLDYIEMPHTNTIISVLLVAAFTPSYVATQRYKTIYQRIQNEPQYSRFEALIRNNRLARLNVHYESLTVFVPENQAFDNFNGEMHSGLAFYHMSFEVKTLRMLQTTKSMTTANLTNPPLWFTAVNHSIYVNNAKILREKSNYVSRSRTGSLGKEQVLHMIDEVLDPMITSPRYSPNAYDFLTSSDEWNLGATKLVTSFYHKVQENNLLEPYKRPGGHTFFIPIDSGIDPHKFKMINKNIILGHIIPDNVLFTRPTEKRSSYETLASNRLVYIMLSLEENDGKMFVRGLSKGDLGHGEANGDFYSEIVTPNIPVQNGVVHLISQPLGVFNRTLKLFPYLQISQKVAIDPELDWFYEMGERTGFNKILLQENTSYTYFIPKDKSWNVTKTHGLKPIDDELTILKRHLVISPKPYSIEQLVALSRANNYSDIVLRSEGGPLRLTALKIEDEYYIKWNKRYIKVVRPNYECTDGIVHILTGPMVDFRRMSDEGQTSEQLVSESGIGGGLGNYWSIIKDILS